MLHCVEYSHPAPPVLAGVTAGLRDGKKERQHKKNKERHHLYKATFGVWNTKKKKLGKGSFPAGWRNPILCAGVTHTA